LTKIHKYAKIILLKAPYKEEIRLNDLQLAKMAEIMEREAMTENQKVFFEKYLRATFRLRKIMTKPATFKGYGVSYNIYSYMLGDRKTAQNLAKEVFPDFELESQRFIRTDDEAKKMIADYANRTGEVPSFKVITRANREVLPSVSSIRKIFGHIRMREICDQLKEEGLITRDDLKFHDPSNFRPTVNPRSAM
jgi:hypothetical protein